MSTLMAAPQWPWSEVGDMMSTIKPGLHILASSPGFGKTTYLSCCLRGFGQAGHRVLVFGTELPELEQKRRYVCQERGLDFDLVAGREWGKMEPGVQREVEAGIAAFDRAPLNRLRFHPRKRVSPEEVIGGIRAAAAEGIRVVAIDHMAAVAYRGGLSPQALIEFCGELQDVVTEHDVACLCVSQLNRPGAGSLLRLESPQKEWLYGGAALEHYATTITMLGPAPRLDLKKEDRAQILASIRERGGSTNQLHEPAVTVVHCVKHRTLGRRPNRGDGAHRYLRFYRHTLHQLDEAARLEKRDRSGLRDV